MSEITLNIKARTESKSRKRSRKSLESSDGKKNTNPCTVKATESISHQMQMPMKINTTVNIASSVKARTEMKARKKSWKNCDSRDDEKNTSTVILKRPRKNRVKSTKAPTIPRSNRNEKRKRSAKRERQQTNPSQNCHIGLKRTDIAIDTSELGVHVDSSLFSPLFSPLLSPMFSPAFSTQLSSPTETADHSPILALTAAQLQTHYDLSSDTCDYLQALFVANDANSGDVQVLYRQMSVEMGLSVETLTLLRQRGVFDRNQHSAAHVSHIPFTAQESTFSSADDTLICTSVLEWQGKGRGLWEQLATLFHTSTNHVMHRWSLLMNVSDQEKWCRQACIARLYRTNSALCDAVDIALDTAIQRTFGRFGFDELLYPSAHRYFLQILHHRVVQYNTIQHTISERVFWDCVRC